MNKFLEDLVILLEKEENAIEIDSLAEMYVRESLSITEDTIEYIEMLNTISHKIKKIIYKVNQQFTEDKLPEPFLIKGSSNNLILKSDSFQVLQSTSNHLTEDSNEFSDRIGSEILRKIGCCEDDIHITPKTLDKGIDYWGKVRFDSINGSIESFILVIGQVKRYNNFVPVAYLREFIGAVETALKTDFFGSDVTEKTPYLLQFVTTGEITLAGKEVAEKNKINIISKRNLEIMNLLKS